MFNLIKPWVFQNRHDLGLPSTYQGDGKEPIWSRCLSGLDTKPNSKSDDTHRNDAKDDNIGCQNLAVFLSHLAETGNGKDFLDYLHVLVYGNLISCYDEHERSISTGCDLRRIRPFLSWQGYVIEAQRSDCKWWKTYEYRISHSPLVTRWGWTAYAVHAVPSPPSLTGCDSALRHSMRKSLGLSY